MIGSNGPRMLGIALPHVDAWNTWYEDYGNTADGFAALNERISAAARDGRARSRGGRAQRVRARRARPAAASARRRPRRRRSRRRRIAAHLRELAEAGADEAILVVDPIDERSVRELAELAAGAR